MAEWRLCGLSTILCRGLLHLRGSDFLRPIRALYSESYQGLGLALPSCSGSHDLGF